MALLTYCNNNCNHEVSNNTADITRMLTGILFYQPDAMFTFEEFKAQGQQAIKQILTVSRVYSGLIQSNNIFRIAVTQFMIISDMYGFGQPRYEF